MINEIINMTQENEIFMLHVDDKVFNLTRRTIETYPNTLLANVINGIFVDNRIIRDGRYLYIDRDPESFKYVVYYLRNYEVDLDLITNVFLKKQVIDDLDHFGLYCNYDKVNDNHNVVPMVGIVDEINTNDNQNITQNDDDPMQQFMHEIISNKLSEEEMLSKFQQHGSQIGGELLNGNMHNSNELINKLSNNKLFQNLNQKSVIEDSSTDTIDFSDNENSEEFAQNSPEQESVQHSETLHSMDDSSDDDGYEIL